MSEPFRTRSQQQLKVIFKFYRTSEPPTNIPLRLSLPDDVFSHAVKEWLLGFTHFHRHQFPPLHKPRAPFVHIKGRTWGQSLFNFRHWLRWWYADQKIECKCDQFPAHIQRKSRELPHIVAWATDCFPHVPQFKLHMASEQPPRWQHLFSQATIQFEQWLKRWRLPGDLQQYWQYFLRQQWDSFSERETWTQPVGQLQRLLSPFVVTPADHFPHSLLVMCPQCWHALICQTFLQPEVFVRCLQPAEDIRRNIRLFLPGWIQEQYAWGLNFQAALSTAYILPKPTRNFKKARPIVDCSHSWILRLGTALAIVLLEISKAVYPELFEYNEVATILAAIHQIFSHTDPADELTILQQDIAGFYNQVSHERITASVQYVVQVFQRQQQCPHDQVLQAVMMKHNRTLRVFRGRWRAHTKRYHGIRLDHIVPLTQYLLQRSIFRIGHCTFRQVRGASMGSQWAPIMCALVALNREHTHSMLFSNALYSGKLATSSRYVDNRMLVDRASTGNNTKALRHLWHLKFYTEPILLEEVEGYDALGFNVNPLQRTVSYQLPWDTIIRTHTGIGPSRSVTYQKFQAMLANGELPPFIQKEWERVSKLKSGKRERQTAIINAIYDRSAAGRLILNTDKAIFETMRSDYQDTKSRREMKTLPLLLFCGKFRLSAEAVQQGLREGQFMEVETANGKEYGWRQSTFSEVKGVKTATGYKMSEEGDKDTMQKYMEMAQCWKSGIQRPQAIASGSNRLAICDVESPLSQEEWGVAHKQLQSAFAALDQQEKHAMKHMAVIEQNEDEPLYPLLNLVCIDGRLLFFITCDHFSNYVRSLLFPCFSRYPARKAAIQEIRRVKAEITHVQSFKELPFGMKLTLKTYNDFLHTQGQICEAQKDVTAGIKGQLDQRAKRAKKNYRKDMSPCTSFAMLHL